MAAWNGGFKAVHGHYGMMTDGVVWLPAESGMATAAVDAEGRLTIGAWGRGVKPDQAWAAWRQNNPPLIENGVINPDVIKLANTIKWGASLDGAVFIWRSGMGMTRGGRWLIAAGHRREADQPDARRPSAIPDAVRPRFLLPDAATGVSAPGSRAFHRQEMPEIPLLVYEGIRQ